MTDTPLQGVGVLVTRPLAQSTELVAAIQSRGGNAICFPVIEIVPRDAAEIAADASGLPQPDIVIFVSSNAVAHGLSYAEGASIAAIGPATAGAIRSAGQFVEIEPDKGHDSESLLATPALENVAGKEIRIIHGGDGRALLADTLRERGATVNYLAVYDRRPVSISPASLAEFETLWQSGKIDVITVMSIETLKNLLTALPKSCLQEFENVSLVTPAARVIKEALDRYPASRTILASGTQATEMVDAIVALHQPGPAS